MIVVINDLSFKNFFRIKMKQSGKYINGWIFAKK